MKDTMTVIELLNKIANKEEVPNKIKYGICEYEWVLDVNDGKWSYVRRISGSCVEPFEKDLNLGDWETLNSTVTILECDKPLKRLKDLDEVGMLQIDFLQVPGTGSEYIQIDHDLRTLKYSLNDCIRRVNLLTKEIRGDK